MSSSTACASGSGPTGWKWGCRECEAAEIAGLRDGAQGDFDLVIEIEPGEAVEPLEQAGATWVLTSFDERARLRQVEAAIDDGPAA